MKLLVLSYSLTGNNDALAGAIAQKANAKHIRVHENKKRTMGTILADLLFNISPKAQPGPSEMDGSDAVVFVGPIWLGMAATPLRPYLKYAGAHSIRYAFVSVSGGADGPNTKLARDLKKRAGREADALLDLHIADLLPPNPKPERKDTSAYRVTARDVQMLSDKAVRTIKAAL